MLLPFLVINLFVHFLLVLANVVDTTESGKNVPSDVMIQLNSFSSKVVTKQISEFQKSLQAVQETQSILLGKINTLFNGERKNLAPIEKKRRTRRGVEGDPLTTLPNQNGCIPGNFGCPLSVIPYSVGGSCILCPEGPRGFPGPPGTPGRDGRDGRDSVPLATSAENCGNIGDSGNDSPRTTSGTVYIRWGHTECPSHSTLIYSGTAAGPNHNAAGNGVNQLCLPENPIYDNPVAGVGTSRAFLYSLEYQIDSFPALQSHSWKDVSCAVCKSPSRFAQLMVPGKQTCPSGEWTLEYSGYLMTERSHPNHKRSMYICVDRELQSKPHTHGHNGDRAALNLVEGRCISSGGGLPCGPYVDGYEITCAVCTQ